MEGILLIGLAALYIVTKIFGGHRRDHPVPAYIVENPHHGPRVRAFRRWLPTLILIPVAIVAVEMVWR